MVVWEGGWVTTCHQLNLLVDTYALPRTAGLCIPSSLESSDGKVVMVFLNLRCTVGNFFFFPLQTHCTWWEKARSFRLRSRFERPTPSITGCVALDRGYPNSLSLRCPPDRLTTNLMVWLRTQWGDMNPLYGQL